MSTLAVKVIDPSEQPWAQLLDASQPVRRLLPPLVERLGLPEKPNYELVHLATGRALSESQSLTQAGLTGGEELLLRPIRDGILDAILSALYGEAAGLIAKKAFGDAAERLGAIHRLDPTHPDPDGLWRKVATGGQAGTTAARSASGGSGTVAGVARGASGARGAGRAGRAAGQSQGGCLVVFFLVALLVFIVTWISGTLDPYGMPPWPFHSPTPTSVDPPITIESEPTLGTGDVQITLRWDNDADLDLHVVDPFDDEVYYGRRNVESGGHLDVDANRSCGDDPAVENIYWPTGGAPSGTYVVRVVHFKPCSSTEPANYSVTVKVDGRVVDETRGRIAPNDTSVEVSRFSR